MNTIVDEPTHLLAFAGDKRTLCNRKTRDTRKVVVARFVTRHQQGHADTFDPCEDCMQVARDHNISLDVPVTPEK